MSISADRMSWSDGFARAGAAVIINYPAEADRDAGEAIAGEVCGFGAQSRAVRADVASEGEVAGLVAAVRAGLAKMLRA